MKASELADIMKADAELIAKHLLPNGKRDGREWRCGSVDGEEGNSLGVCLEGNKQGVYCEFNGSESGDLLDLWMNVRDISLPDAIKEVMDYLGIEDERPQIFKRKKVFKPPVKPNCQGIKETSAVFKYLTEERRLSRGTIEKFKLADAGDKIVLPFIRDDKPVMIKTLGIKLNDKGKKEIKPTSAEQEPCLFGWQAVDPQARSVVITEGEIDAMSIKEIGYNALSIPFGAGTKNQDWIENEYDRINRFDDIYLCMDDDEAGEQAKEIIIDRLGRHRCKILKLNGYKDPNEALQNGFDIFDLEGAIKEAKTCDPEELRQLSDFHDDIMGEFYPKNEAQIGSYLPWTKTKDLVRLRKGEISVWGGINSHGKSVLLSQVMVDCVSQGDRVCIASMEMSAADTGMKMYQQIGGVDIPSPEYAKEIRKFIVDGVWIFNLYGTAKAERILQVFEYAKNRYGIRQFVVDSLSKCGIRDDDYNKQKEFIDTLMEFAGEHNVHVHVVVHIRKQENEKGMPGKMDLKGSGGISDMVDNVFVVYRNKNKEEALNGSDEKKITKYKGKADTYLSVDKQRKTGKEPVFGLWFHEKSCQFVERDGEQIKRYIY